MLRELLLVPVGIDSQGNDQTRNPWRLHLRAGDARGALVPARPVQRPGFHLAQGRPMVPVPPARRQAAGEGRDGILNPKPMKRRSFIQSIAIVGFGNLFLPRALDHFRWKVPAVVDSGWITVSADSMRLSDYKTNPDYVNAPYEEGFFVFKTDGANCFKHFWNPCPLRFAVPVDPSNREEVERHSIPPFIRVPRI